MQEGLVAIKQRLNIAIDSQCNSLLNNRGSSNIGMQALIVLGDYISKNQGEVRYSSANMYSSVQREISQFQQDIAQEYQDYKVLQALYQLALNPYILNLIYCLLGLSYSIRFRCYIISYLYPIAISVRGFRLRY